MLGFKAALRYIKKGEAKTVLAIVSVSLAVYLMTIIAVAGTSFVASLRQSVIRENGNYHIKMINASQDVYRLTIKCQD